MELAGCTRIRYRPEVPPYLVPDYGQ
jgi:hypothetical protein